MPTLNDDMLQLACPILEKYRALLLQHRRFDAHAFEHELRHVWSNGYRSLKDFMKALAQHGRFQEVAAYYMEHSNAAGVVSEFKPCLAALYGVKSYNHDPDLELKRDQFWRRTFGEETT